MSPTARAVIVIVLAALVVGLVAFGRGREHRRGDEVGALEGPVPVLVAPVA